MAATVETEQRHQYQVELERLKQFTRLDRFRDAVAVRLHVVAGLPRCETQPLALADHRQQKLLATRGERRNHQIQGQLAMARPVACDASVGEVFG